MKKLLALILTLCMVPGMLPTGVIAADETAAETVAEETAELLWEYELYGEGVALTKYLGTATDVYVPSKIEADGTKYPVIKLGDSLFEDNDALNSVTLGDGITEIGARAFYDADNLVCIVTNEQLTTIRDQAFYSCDSFNSIILYDAVSSIGTEAFSGCPNLVVWCYQDSIAHEYVTANSISFSLLGVDAEPEIYELDGITYYIMDGEAVVVSYNTSLKNIVIPSTVKNYPVTEIRANTFEGGTINSVELPQTIKTIGSYAFKWCRNLLKINIPDSIVEIGEGAFYYCQALSSEIVIPEGMTKIEPYVFYTCAKIPKITLSDNITEIGKSAFWYCRSVTELNIPQALTTIGDGAFTRCEELTEITLPQSVTSIGNRAFQSCRSIKRISIPNGISTIGKEMFYGCASLEYVDLPDTITTIESYAFYECKKLPAINIPSAVETIGHKAFYGCTSLLNVTLPKAIVDANAFQKCTALKSVTLLESTLADYAFLDCESLEQVILSEGVTTIGIDAFAGCSMLKSVSLPESLTEMTVSTEGKLPFPDTTVLHVYENSYAHTSALTYDYLYYIYDGETSPEFVTENGISFSLLADRAVVTGFDGSTTTVEIPAQINGKSVTEIRRAFEEKTSLTMVILPESITNISLSSFSGCTSLTEIKLPSSLTVIDDYAFSGCTALTSVTIPDSVEEIGKYAFNGCSSIADLTIGNNVDSIGEYAFKACTGLSSVAIPENTVDLGSGIFYQCTALRDVTINSALTTIPSHAFYGCTSLTNIILPDTVTKIGASAFASCTSLVEIVIPTLVVSIGSYAFSRCTSLNNIELHDGIKSLGDNTFAYCSSLTEVVVPGSVTTIPAGLFNYSGVETVVFSEGTTGFANYIFTGVTSLKELTIPGSVELVRRFVSCSSLEKLNLSEGNKQIEYSAFNDCNNLLSVVIPKSVKTWTGGNVFFSPNTILLVYEDSVAHQQAVASGWNFYIYDGVNLPEFKIIDGVTYAVLSDHAVAISYDGSVTSVTVPAEINGVPVTEINEVFSGSALESIALPDTIIVIENDAFNNCDSLVSVDFPDNITKIGQRAFDDCDALVEIEIPGSVTNIGFRAFYDCSALEKVTLNHGTVVLEEYAFAFCRKLSQINLPETVVGLWKSCFRGCSSISSLELPSGVTQLAEGVFYGCGFKSIDLKNITYIGSEALSHSLLTELILPKSVTWVNNDAFKECKSLVSVTILPGCTVLPAFIDCTSLTSVEIPEGVTQIPYNGFKGCSALKTLDLPTTIKSIGTEAFEDCGVTELTLTDTCTEIGSLAFYRARHLRKINLPDTITKVGDWAFFECGALTEINLSGVTSIGENAFRYCYALNTVTTGNALETVSAYAFMDSDNLRFIYMPESVTTLNADAFHSTTVLMVYKDSYAHTFAVENGLLYFIIRKTENPEVAYGTGLSGTVTYTDGSVAAGVTVEIIYDDGVSKETVVTDENGVYEFTYAEVGAYTIRATDADGNTFTTPVSVKRMNAFNVFTEGDTDLTLKKGYNVSGTVSEGGATVTVTDGDANVITSVTADENGAFTIENLPNGTYVITATAEQGSASTEVTVYNGDVSGITLTIATETVTLWGYVEVEDREFKHHRRNWVQITVYNEEGVAVAQRKSDGDGKYTFKGLPTGEYSIVAETAEMRKDRKHGFDRSHTLIGYAYVSALTAGEYEVDTIVLYEENDHTATISGKVTANGQGNRSEVRLVNVFRHEVAKMTTGSNGKYSFKNVKDGLYYIIATTERDGMGMEVVAVRNGKVYGDTDIRIHKTDKIKDREDRFRNDIPDLDDRDGIHDYRDRIAEEKRFYDGLSEKEKRQLSRDYTERLNKYCEWLANTEYTADDGVKVEGGGLILSGDELESEDTVSFNIDVAKKDAHNASTDGVHDRDDFIHHRMNDTADGKDIVQYYEITMSKTVGGEEKAITSVYKDTDATGKFRITITIPEEYRGHAQYTMLHEHHGEVVTLADLDDDPDTITVEVDRFSTFALAASDESNIGEVGAETGDVNADEVINVLDMTLTARYIAQGGVIGTYDLTDCDTDAMDANSDGVIDQLDLNAIAAIMRANA